MIKIELVKFEAQDIITVSGGAVEETKPVVEVVRKHSNMCKGDNCNGWIKVGKNDWYECNCQCHD